MSETLETNLQPALETEIPALLVEQVNESTEAHTPKTIEYEVVETIQPKGDEFVRIEGTVFWKENGQNSPKYHFLCNGLSILAYARNKNGRSWGRLLEFKDLDGTTHKHFVLAQNLRRDGDQVISDLRDMGLVTTMNPFHLKRLINFIFMAKPQNEKRVTSTDRTGWQDENVYLLSDNSAIGEAEEEYVYLSSSTAECHYSSRGTHEEWVQSVATLCRGNSRLMLAICLAFAAVMLSVIGVEGGGINLYGHSSGGKTTALNVAASVCGRPRDYILRWRATDNGLEGMAKLHNDALLILDELGEMNPNVAGGCAYLLANGGGKIRSKTTGDAKGIAKWLILFLSSGEITLAEHMAEGGKVARAGQEIRCVDLPADAGADMGLFEDIHGYQSPADFADILKRNSELYHGTALPLFIIQVIENRSIIAKSVAEMSAAFIEGNVPENSDGQIRRVANRFALVAAAGELATQLGITGWEEDEAYDASSKCFQDWYAARGHDGNQESVRILTTIRGYLQQYGDARFIKGRYNHTGEFEVDDYRILNRRDGFRVVDGDGDTVSYYILPESFNVICSGLNMHNTRKYLLENHYLEAGSDGKSSQQRRLPTMGQIRVYNLKNTIMES